MQTLTTRKEAAAHLRVSTRTIARYERKGRLTPIRLTSRAVRYQAYEIERLIAESSPGGCS